MQIYNFAQDAEDLLSKIINHTTRINLRGWKEGEQGVIALPESHG